MAHDADEIARLIRDGRKIDAIKALREATGISLEQAKEEVDRLAAGVDRSMEPPVRLAAPHSASGVSPEVLDLARRGKKLDAIALHRKQTGMSLVESKAKIEKVTGIKGGGCLPALVLAAAAATGAVLLLAG